MAHDAALIGLSQGRIKSVQVDGGDNATGVPHVGDTAYAVSGSATSATDPPDVEPVWRDGPSAVGRSRESMVSIGPVVDLDHELSDRWSPRN